MPVQQWYLLCSRPQGMQEHALPACQTACGVLTSNTSFNTSSSISNTHQYIQHVQGCIRMLIHLNASWVICLCINDGKNTRHHSLVIQKGLLVDGEILLTGHGKNVRHHFLVVQRGLHADGEILLTGQEMLKWSSRVMVPSCWSPGSTGRGGGGDSEM